MKKIIALILLSFSLQSQTLIKPKQIEGSTAGSVLTTTGAGTPTWTNTLPYSILTGTPTIVGAYEPKLNGTGFVKSTGALTSYDNTSYIPTSSVSAFQPTISGGYIPYVGANSFTTTNNITGNNITNSVQSVTSVNGTTTLTVLSPRDLRLIGSSSQTIQLPNATTLPLNNKFEFNNNSTGTLTIVNSGGSIQTTIQSGGYCIIDCQDNSTSNGTWDFHFLMPANSQYGTNSMAITGSLTTTGDIRVAHVYSNRHYGGTGVSDGIDYYSTKGAGTASGQAHVFRGGTDGATTILTMLNNGTIRIPSNRIIQCTDAGGTNRSLLTWSSGDNIEFNGRPGVTDIVLNPTSGGVGLYVKSGGDIGLGAASPSARAHIIKTTEQLRVGYDVSNYFNSTVGSTGSVAFGFVGTTPEVYFNTTGSTVIGNKAALTTTATAGFLYVPTCAGVPTGVPTAVTGKVPIVIDATNNRMYIYSGGAWVALN